MRAAPEYRIWADLKNKCMNPKHQEYSKYGGAGVTICDEWSQSFSAFYRDMGSRPSVSHVLRRYDNGQPFCVANCRWIKTRSRVPKSQRHEVMRDLGVLASEDS
jgi:hypothetical protein